MEVKLKLTADEHRDLVAYCNLNDLLISSVVKDSFTTGFNIERYGLLNAGPKVTEKVVEKEVIKYIEVPKVEEKEIVKVEYVEVEKPVEKIVEVIKEVEKPVEKIVEVIKEVPVEKIVEVIKEVPVEKVVVKEVIKEVPVDKVVYITDQEEMKSKIFQKEIEFEEQRKNFSIKLQEMENFFQNTLSDKNRELDDTRRSLDELLDKPPIEKIVEVIKEVPVEKVIIEEKIIEVIKEVPVEKVVFQEVVVEKEVQSDNNKIDALQKTIQKLRQENIDKEKVINELNKSIQDIQDSQKEKKAIYLRGSNLDDKLYK